MFKKLFNNYYLESINRLALISEMQIYEFCDASNRDYKACLYVCSNDEYNNINCCTKANRVKIHNHTPFQIIQCSCISWVISRIK